jgi:ferredoxin
MFIIDNNVINLPVRNRPNYDLLSLCDGCNLCAKNCPAKAIHLEDGKPYWLDANACRTFFIYGDHPNISTVKYSINKFLHNKYSNEELLKVVDKDSFKKLFGFEEQETVVNLNGKYY